MKKVPNTKPATKAIVEAAEAGQNIDAAIEALLGSVSIELLRGAIVCRVKMSFALANLPSDDVYFNAKAEAMVDLLSLIEASGPLLE